MSIVITESEVVANIAYNVRELMRDRGWSQSVLAQRTKLSEMQISRVIRGKHQVGAFYIARLIEAFHCSFDCLVREPPEKIS
jgi:transcriptional regulator with XRE-family HTH domain